MRTTIMTQARNISVVALTSVLTMGAVLVALAMFSNTGAPVGEPSASAEAGPACNNYNQAAASVTLHNGSGWSGYAEGWGRTGFCNYGIDYDVDYMKVQLRVWEWVNGSWRICDSDVQHNWAGSNSGTALTPEIYHLNCQSWTPKAAQVYTHVEWSSGGHTVTYSPWVED